MIHDISLIGLGYIGKIHLKLLKENPNWHLAGVYDIDRQLCEHLAAQYNVKAFKSLEEAIAESPALDIVTPSTTHFDISRQAVVSGRHVFIEKPVTSHLREARQLQSLISEAGVCFQVGHVERFNPAYIAAQPYIRTPGYIEVHRLAQYNPRGTDVSVVLDLMMHDLDLVLNMVRSNVKRIQAWGNTLVSATPDVVNARLEFENGCIANVSTNRVALRNKRTFHIHEGNNLININLLDKVAEVTRIETARPGTSNQLLVPGRGLPNKEIVTEHPIILPTNAINEELNAFYQSVNSNKMAKVNIYDAITVLELAFEIEEQLKL